MNDAGRRRPGAGDDGPPPPAPRLGALDAVVIVALAVEIALLAWLTGRFR